MIAALKGAGRVYWPSAWYWVVLLALLTTSCSLLGLELDQGLAIYITTLVSVQWSSIMHALGVQVDFTIDQ